MGAVKRGLLAIVCTLLVIALAGALLISAVWANCRWGAGGDTLPGWIEALSTFAAFIAAVIAVAFAAGAFRLEVRRENRWHHDARRAQASLVAGWIEERTEVTESGRGSYRMGAEQQVMGLALRNASELPVTDVWVGITYSKRGNGMEAASLETLPPGSEPRFYRFEDTVENMVFNENGEPSAVLLFTDAAGIRWRRADGVLEEWRQYGSQG